MKLSLLTSLALAWLYGTIAGLMLPHGPIALALYGLLLLAATCAAQVVRRTISYQLAMIEFRQEMNTARRLAAQAIGGN